ncbi:MAG: hypothetical protein SW019_09500 [Actinomycetota bacterium]|nr:hypothetical protein [Actinomycetota bacterium]
MTAPTAYASAASDDLQPTIDQLLSHMEQAVAFDSTYPNTTPINTAMLPAALQALEFKNLNLLLNQQTPVPYFDLLPENTAGPSTDSRRYFGANNPDNIHLNQTIDPDETYVVTIDPGPGTADINVTTGFLSLLAPSAGANLNISQMVPNADGTYTVIVSNTRPPNALNWIDSTGANTVAFRNTLGDWAAKPAEISVEGPATTPTVPGVSNTGLSAEAISYLLTTLAETTQTSNYIWANVYADLIGRGPENGFTDIAATIGDGALAGQASSFGRFVLEPDQAIVLTVPAVNAAYSGIEVANAFGLTLGYATAQTSLNHTEVVPNADGSITYVISAVDPGVPNWLDTTGVDAGDVVLRWQNVSGEITDTTITSEVVAVADVRDHMPEGTPTVTPEERAATLRDRLLSYNYILNGVRGRSWVTLNLQFDDLEAAMGTADFEAVFGAQPSVPLSARLGPELSPDLGEVARAVLTRPLASLAAVVETLPQAVRDVMLPTELAALRMMKVVNQTVASVATAIMSGQPRQIVTALATGAQGLASAIHDAIADPNTSITAGILNARDDLGLQITEAADRAGTRHSEAVTTPDAGPTGAALPDGADVDTDTATADPSESGPEAGADVTDAEGTDPAGGSESLSSETESDEVQDEVAETADLTGDGAADIAEDETDSTESDPVESDSADIGVESGTATDDSESGTDDEGSHDERSDASADSDHRSKSSRSPGAADAADSDSGDDE